MARRKKEPQGNHRKAIAQAATKLFSEKGFDNTSMADIAKESGYSKASLYVFFKDKDELLAYLTLESMTLLYDNLSNAVNSDKTIDEKYQSICDKLVEYYEDHPLYFSLMLKTIRIDPSQPNFLDEERDTFNVGQKISELISSFISSGIEKGCFRKDLDISDNGNTKLERLLFKVFSKFKHEPLCLYVMIIEFIIYVGMVITMIKII